MKNLLSLLLIFLFLNMPFAQADEASERASYLRRVSLLLKGVPPSEEEMEQAWKTSADQYDTFLNMKMDEYMSSNEFSDVMVRHVQALFQVSSYSSLYPDLNPDLNSFFSKGITAFEQMIVDMLEQNKSWDELFVGSHYRVPVSSQLADKDLDFFQNVAGVEQSGEFYNISASQPALAGLLTTSRFFKRYFNTRLNENRKRAAAIYKVALCDAMDPVLIVSQAERDRLTLQSLNAPGTSAVSSVATQHGTDPACQSCHEKLDPLGAVFARSMYRPNPGETPGSLLLRDMSGAKTVTPFKNISEFAKVLVNQQAYVECQTRNLWNMFVGKDVGMPTDAKFSQVFASDSVQRRPKEFIKYLLRSTRTTAAPLSASNVRFSDVKPILEKCQSCHENEPLAPASRLDSYQSWNGDLAQTLADQVIKESGLSENPHESSGLPPSMPPKDAGWELTGRNRELLKAWIMGLGLPGTASQSLSVNARAFESKPSFGWGHQRVLSGIEIYAAIFSVFPDFGKIYSQYSDCRVGDKVRMNNLGFHDPIQSPGHIRPIPVAYRMTIYNCLDRLTYSSTLEKLGGFQAHWPMDRAWHNIAAELKNDITIAVIKKIIGVHRLDAQQMANLKSRLAVSIKNSERKQVRDVVRAMMLALLVSPEFLFY